MQEPEFLLLMGRRMQSKPQIGRAAGFSISGGESLLCSRSPQV